MVNNNKKRIVIEEDLYRKILHYARKDETWTQTLERLYNEATTTNNRIWTPVTYPDYPNPLTNPFYKGPQCEVSC